MLQRNILLVDDEENILRSLIRLFRRDGYNIISANSGQEGLKLLEDNEVGVIISDQRMPQMTGVEFLSKVKELYPSTVRIVLSGYTDLNSITDAINQGAIYKFLTKPWDDELLRENVIEAFEIFELKQENDNLKKELQSANDELKLINQDLERRVAKKTQEIMFNMKALQISQDVLENLPMAVLGVGDDGVIAVANHLASEIVSDEDVPLLGSSIEDIIPSAMQTVMQHDNAGSKTESYQLKLSNNKTVEACSCRLGTGSNAKGFIIVLKPQ